VAIVAVVGCVGLLAVVACFLVSVARDGQGPVKDRGFFGRRPAKVGERTEAGGIAFTVEKVDRRAEVGRSKAADGREFLVAEVVIESAGRDELPYNPLNFGIRNPNGVVYAASATYSLPERLQGGTLARGEKVRGTVAFEVKQGSAGLVLSYHPGVIADDVRTFEVALD
jgi:hypothetical protein